VPASAVSSCTGESCAEISFANIVCERIGVIVRGVIGCSIFGCSVIAGQARAVAENTAAAFLLDDCRRDP
jgi:hypothetical protein